MPKKNSRFTLIILLLIIFLDFVGIGMVFPILTPLLLGPENGLTPGGWSLAQKTITLGFLIGSYPLAQFFGAPILGALSDKHGRKKILSLSLLGTILGYCIFGIGVLTHNLALLFLGRSLDGFTGGNISVANSAIADISTNTKDKTKNFGLVGMGIGLGFILGPFFGGVLSDPNLLPWFNNTTPFWFASGLATLNLALLMSFFEETFHQTVATKISMLTGFQNIIKSFRLHNLRALFLVSFLHTFGFAFFTHFLPVLLVQRFEYGNTEIGLFYAYIGVWIAIANGGVSRFLANYVSSKRAVQWALPTLALSVGLVAFPKMMIWLFILQIPIALCEGIIFPNLTALVSEVSTADQQGEVLGITQSLRALGQAAPPILSGFIVIAGVALPTLTAASILLVAWVCFMLLFRQKRHSLT